MRAGELWWEDKAEAFDVAISKMAPKELDLGPWLRASYVVGGRFREGGAFRRSMLDKAKPAIANFGAWKEGKIMELATEESLKRADEALSLLETHLASFRSKIGNDLTSIKAASQRVQTEVTSMAQKYQQAQAILTSQEFEKAVENAERMAKALEAISQVSGTQLNVSLFAEGAK